LLAALTQHVTGSETVPQVFINGKFIGGGDDTEAKFKSGELTKLLTKL
jgi:glutaredoxin 3